MAHGNEVRGLLGSHHAGDLRDGQDIALGNLAPLNFFKGFRLEKDYSLSRRSPFGRAFALTSTIRARPDSLKCVNSAILSAESARCRNKS